MKQVNAPLVKKAPKPKPKYNLDILKEFPSLINWLQDISRFKKLKDFVFISDYKEKKEIRLRIFTKDHQYSITACLPQKSPRDCDKCKGKKIMVDFKIEDINQGFMHCLHCGNIIKNKGYLGCIVQTRKSRAGETWNRGNDLADGGYSEKTWQKIKDDILAYELVKVVRNASDEREK